MYSVADLARELETAPRRRNAREADPSLGQKITYLLEGAWTAEDVLEMHVDELSTTGSVGSGVERPLLGNEHYEKLVRRFQTRYPDPSRVSKADLSEFLETSSPSLPGNVIKQIRERLRECGYRI